MYIKFANGKVFEGTYLGCSERVMTFGGQKKTVYDHRFNINGQEKILSSSSQFLKNQLASAGEGRRVRVEMNQSGVKKLYNVLIWQDEA